MLTRTAAFSFRAIPHGLFSLFFPAECRICDAALEGFTRIPVCGACLEEPAPLEAEHFCAACQAPFQNRFPLDENGVCALCRSGLSRLDRASSFGYYEGTLRKLIHLFKYSRMTPLTSRLSRYLERALPVDDRYDAIVAVPLHWKRRWRRGFNQAELLAKQISKRRRMPLMKALRRVRPTANQSGLTSAARRRNIAGAFQPKPGTDLRGKRVLLIDDVFTTGATASACAAALKRAGAASVSLLTLARADRRWRD
ncbi:MAG TPA: phosphoribosyltransferase family protein [Bryobacteraceae bacterium]|nr:phosphoribosyltransferase family protein [Bryobacteraceae bacterium]